MSRVGRRTWMLGGLSVLALPGRASAWAAPSERPGNVPPPVQTPLPPAPPPLPRLPAAPAIYLGHGGPNLAVSEARAAELRPWGQMLAPRGVVAITPHVRSRGVGLGAVGPGRALMRMPARFRRGLEGVDYRTPDNTELAARVELVLSERYEVSRLPVRGLDHTTWMPLVHLVPDASVPVVEVGLPFAFSDAQLYALGERLGALRREGVMVLASGNLTHNLAAMGDAEAAPWAHRFDTWATERLRAADHQALIDWRRAAPHAYVAHPDDGGHFDVLLVAAGAAGASASVQFPVDGFEGGSLSKRSVQFG